MVRAGDKMPADGIIESGSTIADESAVTGESRGIVKDVGDSIIGGSINGNGTIQVRVTGTGESSFLAQVMELVRKAQDEKSHLEVLSDKVAKWLFYVATSVGIVTFIIWLLIADLPTALKFTVTVLVIACPHALGLAIPLVVSRSTSMAAQNGLLLKRRSALEVSSHLNKMVLDKTGTLTEGKFDVTGVESFFHYTIKEVLAFYGALEKTSKHPISTSIVNYISERNIPVRDAQETENISGKGIRGLIDNQEVQILSYKAIMHLGFNIDPKVIKPYQEQGNTLTFLTVDGILVGMIALGDTVKSDSAEFIKSLKNRGITPIMMTGDNKDSAKAVADYLGITTYFAEMLPSDKEKKVAELVAQGDQVAMVGDGINDAPSLASATLGIAIGAGTDIAIESADLVLINSRLKDILYFLDLAKNTRSKMVQNLIWGAGYNILAIPLAAGILTPVGFILNPAAGAILMSLSTVIVAINAMTLKMK
ncbi:copper-potassium transporting ATPase B [Streptococcus criceti]|uniref:P-type Cu(+) transporter n=1 Tax=Streptococcus criceti HS-6 TaxID=873449 RepID=G5JNZ6_STRCG|nr:copper-exporting P-type ATPase B [Streptococcus criceti HS-6]SUN43406.1 copper-potassium transporting ATPase B [Streptococcus criceti]